MLARTRGDPPAETALRRLHATKGQQGAEQHLSCGGGVVEEVGDSSDIRSSPPPLSAGLGNAIYTDPPPDGPRIKSMTSH